MLMTTSTSKDKQPLPLADILRDLAILRASDVSLNSVLPASDDVAQRNTDLDSSVQRSHEFVQAARATLRIQTRGDVEQVGARVEDVRAGLEEVLKGLGEPASSQ